MSLTLNSTIGDLVLAIGETFEVTAKEYKYYEIGNTFIQDAVLGNKEEDK